MATGKLTSDSARTPGESLVHNLLLLLAGRPVAADELIGKLGGIEHRAIGVGQHLSDVWKQSGCQPSGFSR